jgi:hypothetical protein
MPKKSEFDVSKALGVVGVAKSHVDRFPESFRSKIFHNGRLRSKFHPSVLQNPHLLIAYLIVTDDLEMESHIVDGDDISSWESAHNRGLTLNDWASTWAKALIDDLDDAEDEEKEGTKIYGYERDFLVASMTGSIQIDGKIDEKFKDFLSGMELSWAWHEVESLEDDKIDLYSFGPRILRLKDAHEAGVTLQHMAQAVACLASG